MINSIIDARIPQPTVTNQILVWNNTTELLEASVSLSGLTLNSPVIAGDFSWTGDDVNLDCSDLEKTVLLGTTGNLRFRGGGGNWLEINIPSNSIDFGNITDNPAYNFAGTGLTTFGGNLLVNGGFIGDTDDPELIEIDGAGGIFTVDGDLHLPTEVGGVHGLILGVNALGYVKMFSGDDMYIGNRNNGGRVLFDMRTSGGATATPFRMSADSIIADISGEFSIGASFLNVTREEVNIDAINTIARLFYESTGTTTAGVGAAFSMLTQAGDVAGKNTGYFAGRLDNVGSGTEIGTLCISPDYHASAAYSTDRELCVTAVAADEILVSMTKGNFNITDGDLSASGDVGGATLTAGDGFTGTGAYTNFTITNGIITAAS